MGIRVCACAEILDDVGVVDATQELAFLPEAIQGCPVMVTCADRLLTVSILITRIEQS